MKWFKEAARLSVAITAGLAVVLGGYVYWEKAYSPDTQSDRIQAMYNKLWAQTGLITEYVPLTIDPSDTINAYATTTGITLYQGMIDMAENDDQIALVLGHEIAHVISKDTTTTEEGDNVYHRSLLISVAEARADKLGAVYVMKAGYDVCEARELWSKFAKTGDYLFSDHPGYAYRYHELNINCSSGF